MRGSSGRSDLSSITDSHLQEKRNDQDELDFEFPSVALCGRKDERLLLLNSYLRLRSTNKKQIATVHGLSGSGKTFLVEQSLRDLVSDGGQGYFVSGKCFQNDVSEPYAPFTSAFSDICDLVLQSNDAEKRIHKIQKALKSDGAILTKTMSNLSAILEYGAHDENTHNFNVNSSNYYSISPTTAAAVEDPLHESALIQFTTACKNFLRAISSKVHPTVLFLDDIQWLDAGSQHLLEMILQDSTIRGVMVVLAYREEEKGNVFLGDNYFGSLPKSEAANVVDVELKNLNETEVHCLVTSLLKSACNDEDDDHDDEIKTLSDMVALKTCGNPYHVTQFMDAIEYAQFLCFDKEQAKWIFDVDLIQSKFMVSETLLDLLSLKISHLESPLQDILKIASLLGYKFDETVLTELVTEELQGTHTETHSPEQVSALLEIAVQEKFLERVKEGYQFSHDKLLTAFESMLEDAEHARLHYSIGNKFRSSTNPESVYHAAVHLNNVPEYFKEENQQVDLARVNFDAYAFCKETSAFLEAANFLRQGLAPLEATGDMWSNHFDLAFAMTEALAKIELIIGNLDACKSCTQEALSHSKSIEMSVSLLYIDVEVRMAGNEMDETIVTAYRSLNQLGVRMPRRVTFVNILFKLRRVKKLVGRKTDAEILGLPLMQDHVMATAVRILVQVCMYCLLKDEDMLAVYSALLATELTLTMGGLTPYSAMALVIYGIAEISLGKVDRGFRFGELAMRMLDQVKGKDAECPTISIGLTSLLHWKKPLNELNTPLMQALNSGFERGDVVYASLTVANCCALRYMLGENLESLEMFMIGTHQRLRDLSHKALLLWTQPSFQFVINMRSAGVEWKDLTFLNGEIMNENEFMFQANAMNNTILKMMLWTYKSLLAFHFGFYEVAAEMYYSMTTKGQVYHDSYGAVPYYFYGAMIFYERYRATGQRKHLKTVRKHMKGLKRYEANGSPNASCHLIFLEAEGLSLKARNRDAAKITEAFDKAIQVMQEEGFVHLEALGNERASIVLAGIGCTREAQPYMDRSIDLCRDDWGATAKSERLVEMRCQMFGPPKDECLVSRPGDVIFLGSECAPVVS